MEKKKDCKSSGQNSQGQKNRNKSGQSDSQTGGSSATSNCVGS